MTSLFDIPRIVQGTEECVCQECGKQFANVHGFRSHRIGAELERRCMYTGAMLQQGFVLHASGRWTVPLGAKTKGDEGEITY